MVNHKLDFEDPAGPRCFLDRGVDVDTNRACRHQPRRGDDHHMLRETGTDMNLPWDRWGSRRRPLALAARWAHLAAYRAAKRRIDKLGSRR